MKIAHLLVFISFLVIAGCGEEPTSYSNEDSTFYVKAYQRCVEQTMDECDIKNKGKIPPELNRQLAEAACKIIKTECEKDPEGPVCQSLVKEYREK